MGRCRSLWIAGVLLGFAGAPARSEERSLVDVFKSVNPAVVEIHTRQSDLAARQAGRPVSVMGLGSGVLVSRDGKVITAAHLVQAADSVEVEFLNGDKVAARVVSSEPEATDVATLQLERVPPAALVARFGDSDRVQVGESVFVIGAPLGVSHTLTVGHLSGRRRSDMTPGGTTRAEFFQTDAAINIGNSGGPMFNMDGEVIGIVSHILSLTGGSEGLGFAVSSNVVRRFLEEKSFWTGIDGYILWGDLAQVFNVPPRRAGLLVQRIAAGSPAERAGLRAGTTRATIGREELIVGGDIVLEVMGVPVQASGLEAVKEKLTGLRPGQTVDVVVLRGGRQVVLTAVAPAAP